MNKIVRARVSLMFNCMIKNNNFPKKTPIFFAHDLDQFLRLVGFGDVRADIYLKAIASSSE